MAKDHWDANMYDGNHGFVSKYGESLLDVLAPKKGEKILDVGCGTGDLVNSLVNLGCRVVGVDRSENMIQSARNKYPQIPFFVKDINELDYQNEFDAVFSNATLHWVKPPKVALEAIFRSLRNGGRFVAEFGGVRNVEKIPAELRNQFNKVDIHFESPWYFPSIGQYTDLMEAVGFHVTLAVHYERPTLLEGEQGLKNWIEMFGSSLFENISIENKNSIIAETVNNLKDSLWQESHWVADYKRIRVCGTKSL